MTKYVFRHLGMRTGWITVFIMFISNYREPQPALTGLGAANFMDSEAVIKIEVSGRFNSLGAFRGSIRL